MSSPSPEQHRKLRPKPQRVAKTAFCSSHSSIIGSGTWFHWSCLSGFSTRLSRCIRCLDHLFLALRCPRFEGSSRACTSLRTLACLLHSWDAPSSRDCPNPAPGSTTGVTSASLGREALWAFFACLLTAASTLRLTVVAKLSSCRLCTMVAHLRLQ